MASSTSWTISCSPSGHSSAKETPVGFSSLRRSLVGGETLIGAASSDSAGSRWPIANWGDAGSTSEPAVYEMPSGGVWVATLASGGASGGALRGISSLHLRARGGTVGPPLRPRHRRPRIGGQRPHVEPGAEGAALADEGDWRGRDLLLGVGRQVARHRGSGDGCGRLGRDRRVGAPGAPMRAMTMSRGGSARWVASRSAVISPPSMGSKLGSARRRRAPAGGP